MNKQIIENLKDEISLCKKQIESWEWVKNEKEKLLESLNEKS